MRFSGTDSYLMSDARSSSLCAMHLLVNSGFLRRQRRHSLSVLNKRAQPVSRACQNVTCVIVVATEFAKNNSFQFISDKAFHSLVKIV